MKAILVLLLSATSALADDVDVSTFAASSRQFTGTVYNEILVDNKDNIVVSPFSVETVLALTQSGAIGATGSEIRSTLFLPDTKEATDSLIKKVLPTIHSDTYTLQTANKIYVENNFAIKETFQKVAADVYEASFDNVEFSESIQAAAEINEWVEEETDHKIQNLIAPDELDANTKVVLVNALYFKGNWSHPFDSLETRKAKFYSANDDTVDSDMMFLSTAQLNFYESEELDAKYLELPFEGGEATMTIVLPNKNEGIALLEKGVGTVLTPPKFIKKVVQVSLPKFKIESTINFKDVLEKLGVRTAFGPAADFSGIAGAPGDLVISEIIQKTFINVNEGGVEAAAATAVEVGPTAVLPNPDEIINADHPFAFYISVNGIVLFEGRVLEPSTD